MGKSMSLTFSDADLARIGEVLGANPGKTGKAVRYEVQADQNRKLVLEVYADIAIGKKRGTLISVYTPTAHLQLHFCTGYVVSDMLGEVTFVGEAEGKISGLTIERAGGCSLYANVDRNILSGDFTTLGPEVMMSGIALSLTEDLLPPGQAERKTASARTKKKAGRSAR
ncbi:MAG: hypothetical protein HBSIN02_04680 [Bacteroidia bacterium]|nr:MAG: hypothetical protein HBSIN02_04680 [Bacteroidia bacterium]